MAKKRERNRGKEGEREAQIANEKSGRKATKGLVNGKVVNEREKETGEGYRAEESKKGKRRKEKEGGGEGGGGKTRNATEARWGGSVLGGG